MAHNLQTNDSMIAVGAKPWHGLGVTLDQAPASGREALELASLDWTVSRKPLFLHDAEDLSSGIRPACVSGSVSGRNDGQWAAMVRDDTQEILGVVGPGYTPYQNSQMADLFTPLIQEGGLNIETCGSLYNGRRVWMLGKFGNTVEIENRDAIAKYLLLAHGHDGQFAVRFGFCPIRVVCWNTLSYAVSEGVSKLVKCLHTTNLSTNLERLRDAMSVADEVFELSAQQYRQLAMRGVSRADLREYARIIVDADKDETEWTGQQRTKIGLMVGAAMEGRGNTGRSWWHAYNGVTEYLTWTAGRKDDSRLDSLWWGANSKTSTEALQLALNMSA